MREELLIKYLAGELEEGELDLFLAALDSDPVFKEEVLAHEDIHRVLSLEPGKNSLESKRAEELLTYLNSAEGSMFIDHVKGLKQAAPKRRWINWVAAAAAAIALLVVVNSGFFSKNKTVTYAELADYSSFPSLTQRSGVSNDGISDVEQLFKAGNYAEAISKIESLDSTANERPSILVYKAFSNLELGNDEQAYTAIRKYLSGENIDAPKGHWYLSLLHYKTGKRDSAELILNKIVSDKLPFQEKAEQLLDVLEQEGESSD